MAAMDLDIEIYVSDYELDDVDDESDEDSSTSDRSLTQSVLPYQFEPFLSDSEDERDGGTGSSDDDSSKSSRLTSLDWCDCGHCAVMNTAVESRCCKEIPEVKNKVEEDGVCCITMHPGFEQGCLNPYALEIAYLQHRQQYGAIQEVNQAEKYRYMAYRQMVRWCWGYLGKHRRVPLPACAVTKIRNTFTSSGHYTGFKLPKLN